MSRNETRKKLLEDLEETYMRATAKENYSAALKAKELIGKVYGFFENGSQRKQKEITIKDLDFKKLSENDIQTLILALKRAMGEVELHAQKQFINQNTC